MAENIYMRKFKEYGLCVIGALLVATGVYFFKFPNHFSIGGVSGIAIILSDYFHLSSAASIMFIINMLLLVLGFIFCGKEYGMKTVAGTVTLSVALLVMERVLPIDGPLTGQPFLELVYAVVLPAVGSAILFNSNGSTGGTDIIAMILRRRFSQLNIGVALLCSDVVITAGAFLFSVQTGLFAMLGLILKSLVVDSVIENINLCKCFSIITNHHEEICSYITQEIRRSATIVEAEGCYTHDKKYLVITVLNRLQASTLRKFLRQNYPETFMIITNSSEIIGKGFRGL
ncbi:MAG: YitT family protein [Saccharofermentanales bacterium]